MPNVQQHLQATDFQAFEKQSAPRSKFVKMALGKVSCDPGGVFADSHIDYHWIRNPAEFSLEVAIFAG